MRLFIFNISFFIISIQCFAASYGDCSSEPISIQQDSGLAFCDSFEESDWWSRIWTNSAHDAMSNSPAVTEIVSQTETGSPCPSGKCLRVHMVKGEHMGISVKVPTKNIGLDSPEELYFSYYMNLGKDWVAAGTTDGGATINYLGGKFPGLAHEKVKTKDGYQCGNGGSRPTNGTECWSARGDFKPCRLKNGNTCSPVSSTAKTRIGSYLYLMGAKNYVSNGFHGFWDTLGSANNVNKNLYNCDTHPFNTNCGKANLGILENSRWYHIEMYVKMNTPVPQPVSTEKLAMETQYAGQGDGILKTWVDGNLAYSKTNVIYRTEGHTNLHVRTAWVNLYTGGKGVNPYETPIHLDQIILSKHRMGPRNFGGIPRDIEAPKAPQQLNVQ